MLSGLKFIPRDQIDDAKDEFFDNSRKKRAKDVNRHVRHGTLSSSDEELEKVSHRRTKKKRWYDSNEDLSSSSDESGSQSESKHKLKKLRRQRKERKGHERFQNELKEVSNKSRNRRKEYSPETELLHKSNDKLKHKKWTKSGHEDENWGNDDEVDNKLIDGDTNLRNNNARKEMGLEWMLLQSKDISATPDNAVSLVPPVEAAVNEIKDDSRELNPYLKNKGSGYPDDSNEMMAGGKQLALPVVGDGGASWRLKALKRAQEQADREGRQLQEVVEERWGSSHQFAASVASHKIAPTHAHLHAIKNRRKAMMKDEHENKSEEIHISNEKDFDRRNVEDTLPQHPKMRMPKVHDSLSWGRRGYKNLSAEDTTLVNTAMSNINKFSDDGSFMDKFIPQRIITSGDSRNSSQKHEINRKQKSDACGGEVTKEDTVLLKPSMSANKLAAKAMHLRMKGNYEEAERLLSEAEKMKTKLDADDESSELSISGTTSRYILHDVSERNKKKEESIDLHLAQKIIHNHRYSISGHVDEEYDFDDGPKRKARKGGNNQKSSEIASSAKHFLTQQERCQFCFENPSRPKHLVIAIANFTYLSLPQMQPVVPGHCYIITMQHELSTRSVDDIVWDEIRNFKKCLIMMFAKLEKDVVFLETVMDLSRQRRHSLVECIPLPRDIAKQAPVYFKKAIDEAEDEWSQHNAKKLIDTSLKGLRNSIPKNFPYFHVEFGLNKGFVHVIDNEKDFKSSFGLNVIRGMLQLPAEDMHRKWRHESLEKQKLAVTNFARDWEPFDWTKQLN